MFSHSFCVAPRDIDGNHHVSNIAYVRWVQDVAIAHWNSKATAQLNEKYTWIIVRHEIDYKKEAFEGEEMTVSTWVGEPSRVSWERFTEIKRGDELICQARSVWVLLDRQTGKPSRITSELTDLLNSKSTN